MKIYFYLFSASEPSSSSFVLTFCRYVGLFQRKINSVDWVGVQNPIAGDAPIADCKERLIPLALLSRAPHPFRSPTRSPLFTFSPYPPATLLTPLYCRTTEPPSIAVHRGKLFSSFSCPVSNGVVLLVYILSANSIHLHIQASSKLKH